MNRTDAELFTYSQLRADGWSRRAIDHALRSGTLMRARKGTYVRGDCPHEVHAAVRQGGRVDCVSLLRMYGVFVLDRPALHVQMDRGSTRITERADDGTLRHWRPTRATPCTGTADIVEALAQACRCQPPRAAIATLDSAWHLGIVDEDGIDEIFRLLPRRFAALRPFLDRRSEAGTESLVRLLLRRHGLRVDVQVRIRGVGRVDLLVDGWLIIECDSKEFHEGWQKQRDDRRRDRAAAALGYTTLRLLAEDCLYTPERVLEAVLGLIEAHRLAAHNVANFGRGR